MAKTINTERDKIIKDSFVDRKGLEWAARSSCMRMVESQGLFMPAKIHDVELEDNVESYNQIPFGQ